MSTASIRKERDPRAVAFGQKLQRLLDKRGLSRRGFAKLVSPENPESVRRSVHRHLEGDHMPSRITRRHYEGVLSLEVGTLDEDDSEADPVAFGDAMQKMFDRAVDAAIERKLSSLGVKP